LHDFGFDFVILVGGQSHIHNPAGLGVIDLARRQDLISFRGNKLENWFLPPSCIGLYILKDVWTGKLKELAKKMSP
jgi:hypothetical protein